MNYTDTSCGGRPPLFNQERAERLLEAVARGLPYKLAASYAGISYDTFLRWRRRGRGEDAPEEFRQFCDQLRLAEGEAAFRLVGRVEEAAERGDWRAAGWILSRRHPEYWGANPTHPIPPEEGMHEGFD